MLIPVLSRAQTSIIALALVSALAGCNGGVDHTGDTDTDTSDDGVGNISVSPCSTTDYAHDFGEVEIGSLNSKTFTISNVGNGAIEVSQIGAEPPFEPSASTPVSVAGGSSYQFSVRFQPTEYGEFISDLTIVSDDGDQGTVTCTLRGAVTSDADGDGYDSVDAGGDDCDDEDAEVHPGATESWYDGVDQDCDGADDFDQDGDGYQAEAYNSNPSAGGGDCSDVYDHIYPGAEDIWYDGEDTNCDDADDFDQDGDGYRSWDYGSGGKYLDCDDEDADVNPDGGEVFNGLDDDCDGTTDDEASADEADAILYGDTSLTTGERFGVSTAVGDFDGDGYADLAVGTQYYTYSATSVLYGDGQGAVAMYMGETWADGEEIGDADNVIAGSESDEEFGTTLANVGDWDGDGFDDLAVGAPADDSRAGTVYVFSGIDIETATAADALVTISGKDDFQIGLSLGDHTDIDGDGYYDLVAYGVNSYNTYVYLAMQYGGGTAGSYDWDDIDSVWRQKCGTEPSGTSSAYCGPTSTGSKGGTETFAASAHTGSDIDGDGYHDLVLGDQFYDGDYNNQGRVWILWGRSSEYTSNGSGLDGTATVLTSGSSVKALIGAGAAAIPDADADGDNEIIVVDGGNSDMYYIEGSSDLRSGNFSLSTDADAVLEFGSSMDDVSRVANIGDWTGDGVDDWAVGFGEGTGSDNGYFFLYESMSWSGTYDATTAISGSVYGSADYGSVFTVGMPLSTMDLNSDGSHDLAVGDYGYEDPVEESGAVFLFYNSR